uniref:PEST proteolytic signal-containing nuclear protein n=1 Tax=Steinernema glaseri TaxID=37863 RepID=A0A1I7Y6H1_9BILA
MPVTFGILLCSKKKKTAEVKSPEKTAIPSNTTSTSNKPNAGSLASPGNSSAPVAVQNVQNTVSTPKTGAGADKEPPPVLPQSNTAAESEATKGSKKSNGTKTDEKKKEDEDSFVHHFPEVKQAVRAREVVTGEPVDRQREDYKTFNKKDMPQSDFESTIPEEKGN